MAEERKEQVVSDNSCRAVDSKDKGLEVSGRYSGVNLVIKRGQIIDTFSNYFLTLYKDWIRIEFDSNHYWYPISDMISMVEYNPKKEY